MASSHLSDLITEGLPEASPEVKKRLRLPPGPETVSSPPAVDLLSAPAPEDQAQSPATPASNKTLQ